MNKWINKTSDTIHSIYKQCQTKVLPSSFAWSHFRISSTDSKNLTILYSITNSITGKFCSILGFHHHHDKMSLFAWTTFRHKGVKQWSKTNKDNNFWVYSTLQNKVMERIIFRKLQDRMCPSCWCPSSGHQYGGHQSQKYRFYGILNSYGPELPRILSNFKLFYL